MVVVVPVFSHNIAMCGADLCTPCMLCHPFYVGKDDNRSEVAVHPHSVTLKFCGKRCHALGVSDDCLPPFEIFSCDVGEMTPDVRGLRPLRTFCDGGKKLINILLINIFQVAVVSHL